MSTLRPDRVRDLYHHHAHKPFWPRIEKYMTSGPSVLLRVEGQGSDVRQYALEFRLTYGLSDLQNQAANYIHASENADAAQRELSIFGWGD